MRYNRVRPHEALQMQTPAEVYQPSPRTFPVQVPEPQYPETMLARSVRRKGHFRWKKHDVFLSEVLWSERVGLLPEDERWFTIYFAQYPIARFDSQQLRVTPLPKRGESAEPLLQATKTNKCQECARSKMSGIRQSAQRSNVQAFHGSLSASFSLLSNRVSGYEMSAANSSDAACEITGLGALHGAEHS